MKRSDKKNLIYIILIIICIIALFDVAIHMGISALNKRKENKQGIKNIAVVSTLENEIKGNTAWCGSFQLVWNDLKKELVGGDVVFTPQIDTVKNLNKEGFKEEDLSSEYYYKIYGEKTKELKNKIVKEIKEKFNQTSDILDNFNWSENAAKNNDIQSYFFYTMLFREFKFLSKFDNLGQDKFGSKNNETQSVVEYFGIDQNTKKDVKKQIEVLYYNSPEDFGIIINTKDNDEVILVKGSKENTFQKIYDEMLKKSKEYTGSSLLTSNDEFKMPKINIDILKEYKELAGKIFKTKTNKDAKIEKALQTIKFEINETGGKIKSEAGIGVELMSAVEKEEPKLFYLNDEFTLFLREKGKRKPYYAQQIVDFNNNK